MRRIESFGLGFVLQRTKGREFEEERICPIVLRPYRISTCVKERCVVTLTGLAIDGEEQILAPIDAYECSIVLSERLNEAFLKEQHLEGKSDEELQDWLDERDMAMPGDNVGRFALPTIGKHKKVVVRGTFGDKSEDEEFVPLSLIGHTEVKA